MTTKTNRWTAIVVVIAMALVFAFLPATTFCQITGCTDPSANNYSASATVNNGTCTYNAVAYTPIVKVDPMADTLIETSGLQMAGNFLWSFNDGGGSAAIYRIDTLTNAILQRVYLEGALNVDWEDIAFDGVCFFIGDFGNNENGARTNLRIYKFQFSSIPDHVTSPVAFIPASDISILNFIYSNQPQPPLPVTANTTKFDCEAMIVDQGKIHLFTKNWTEAITVHYRINSTSAGNYVAVAIDTLATGYLVTAADKMPGKEIVSLVGYQNTGNGLHFMHLLSDYYAGKYFNGNKRRLDLPDALTMGQAEGLSFRTNGYGYISNEKFVRSLGPFTITVNQKLRSFDVKNYVNYIEPVIYSFNGNGNWSESANWINGLIPPERITPGSEIIIDPLVGGECILDIAYTINSGIKFSVKQTGSLVVEGNLFVQD